MVESKNKRLNNKKMAMEKYGDDLMGFLILGKPEVTSGECSVGSKSAERILRGEASFQVLWRVPIQKP